MGTEICVISLFLYDVSFLEGQSSYLNFKFNWQFETLGNDFASGIKGNALEKKRLKKIDCRKCNTKMLLTKPNKKYSYIYF